MRTLSRWGRRLFKITRRIRSLWCVCPTFENESESRPPDCA
jgi:hypothetical protein